MIQQSHSLKAFMQNLKTKRYTYTHIQRILMTILLNIKSQDVHKDIHVVRILGMNDIGRNYLKHLKINFLNVNILPILTKKCPLFPK